MWQRWLTGVALAYSEGDGSFTQDEAGAAAHELALLATLGWQSCPGLNGGAWELP